MSTIEVNKITPVSGGTTVQVGESGDTINIPAGATIANAGTATGFGVSLANGADNRVVTASSASALNGEANLTYDGTELTVGETSSNNGYLTISADNGLFHYLRLTNGGSGGGSANTSYPSGIWYSPSGQMEIRAASGATTSNVAQLVFDSGGTLLFGKTSTNFNADGGMITEGGEQIKLTRSGNDEVAFATNYINCNGTAAAFHYSGSTVGTITTTHAATSYNTSSDYRLKENKEDITDGIERLKQLKPYRFNWKNDPNEVKVKVDGFFAHEVSSAIPEAITGTKDATETYTDDNGDEQTRIKPQSIDQSKLVPLLTSALQEAITKIETLEAKVAALESA